MKKIKGKEAEALVKAAERAFRRVARKVRAENKRFGLPLILGENGKIRRVPVRYSPKTAENAHFPAHEIVANSYCYSREFVDITCVC